MVAQKIDVAGLLNTDPLAQMALIGLVCVLVVTAGIFGFLLTQKSRRKSVEEHD
jgi:hypothetical protein